MFHAHELKQISTQIVISRMSSDIISNLQLDRPFGPSRIIIVKEINGCDSCFITSCVINHCVKTKSAVLVVTTHNTFSHYQNVGLKMNCNLQKHVDSGTLCFLNIGDEIVKSLLKGNLESTENIFKEIKEKFLTMKKGNDMSTVNIVFDGISHLFDLQYSLRNVNDLCHLIIGLLMECDHTFVLFHCNVATEDDITRVMANLLSHKAHTVVEVESLTSGWSADVSGRLTIRHPQHKFEEDHIYVMDLKPAKYLFKLFDRGVKLFAPGTV